MPTAFSDLSTESTVTTLAVGRGSNSHQVWVYNGTDQRREFTVEIGDPDAEPWYRRTYAVGPAANVAIDLRASRRYAVTVRVGDRAKTVAVPESRFDCNDSATDVVVRDDEIASRSISTSMDCGGLS